MKERPILMNGAMVRATIDGRKTQTRREYKNRKHPDFGCDIAASELAREPQHVIDRACRYGQPGDRLWVRENFQPFIADDAVWQGVNWKTGAGYSISYPATDGIHEYIDADDNLTDAVKPSIHMPRWASRITLEITDVRVERLQDISDYDAMAEGCSIVDMQHGDRLASVFARLWESINGPGSWDANPWVWVIEFKRVKP